jgi:hypothetical protein
MTSSQRRAASYTTAPRVKKPHPTGEGGKYEVAYALTRGTLVMHQDKQAGAVASGSPGRRTSHHIDDVGVAMASALCCFSRRRGGSSSRTVHCDEVRDRAQYEGDVGRHRLALNGSTTWQRRIMRMRAALTKSNKPPNCCSSHPGQALVTQKDRRSRSRDATGDRRILFSRRSARHD